MALKHLITCIVAGIDYLVHPQVLGSVEESVRADQVIPVVVLSEKEVSSGPEKLWDILHDLVDKDDVCTDEFTGIIVVQPPESPGSLEGGWIDSSRQALESFPDVYHLATETSTFRHKRRLPSGPYFLSGQNLHQAWRLYPDDLDAFTFGLLPGDVYNHTSFQSVAPRSADGLTKTVPVPSRHYFQPSPERPLLGARVSVKDTFDIDGVKATLSSRAWAELYPAAAANAAYVTRLLEQGAVIVGKTKTAQFSAGREWVDFQAPANPRGDGYQEASGSSTGAAASLAGYSWLDHAVGVDSFGGIRDPAAHHGLHAIKPTFGSASLQGVKGNSARYDTVGLFGRSLTELAAVVEHSLDHLSKRKQALSSTRIIVPTDFLPIADSRHQLLFESFIERLEAFSGVERTEVSLGQLWDEHPPTASVVAGESLHKFMKKSYPKAPFLSFSYDYSRTLDPFRSDYHEAFGRQPYFEPSAQSLWKIGANITQDDYNLYVKQVDTFKTWFDETILLLESGAPQDSVVILPYGIEGPQYRDSPLETPPRGGAQGAEEGLDPRMLSTVLGTPHLIVPFAQLPFESRTSGQTEFYPLCASVMGTRGSDLALVRFVDQALRAAGWRTDVDTGRNAFPVGNNSRNVDDGTRHGQGKDASRPDVPPPANGILSDVASREDEL